VGQTGKVCFLRFSKRKRVDDSDLCYFKDKGSIKITSKLEALVRTLLPRSNRLNFDKICIFHKHLRSSFGAERKFLKKIYRSEFLQSSFIFGICLLKEVYRKIISEIDFVGKTRYEDLTETGS